MDSSFSCFNVLQQLDSRRMDCVSSQLNRNSIFSDIDSKAIQAALAEMGIHNNQIVSSEFNVFLQLVDMPSKRQMGSYMGMVLGDSLGAPIEFLPVSQTSNSIEICSTGSVLYPTETKNVFRLELGQWTDDASMGACLADSLLVNQDGGLAELEVADGSVPVDVEAVWYTSFWARDIRSRFWNWCANGYNNAFKHSTIHSPYRSIGLGGNISKSLYAINHSRFSEIPEFYLSTTQDSGNGGLMRLAPVPIFYSCAPVGVCMKYCGLSSQTTHPGVLATRAAECMGFFIHRAINRAVNDTRDALSFVTATAEEYTALYCTEGQPLFRDGNNIIRRLLESNEPVGSTELNWNWKQASLAVTDCMINRGSAYNGYPNSAEYFGSYCLDGFAIALNAFAHSSSFAHALTRCINYRGDADSTGSICGQLAGAFYGIEDIPHFLLSATMRWDDSENVLRAIMLTSWFRREQQKAVAALAAASGLDYDALVKTRRDQRAMEGYTTARPVYPDGAEEEQDPKKHKKTSIFSFFKLK